MFEDKSLLSLENKFTEKLTYAALKLARKKAGDSNADVVTPFGTLRNQVRFITCR